MSKLEELIHEYCPNGVEYRKLGEIASVERGKRVVREQLSKETGYPVYQNSLTIMGYHTDTNYSANTTFVIGAGAAGEIGYSIVDFWAADDCFPVVGNKSILDRFIYHVVMWKKPFLVSKVRKASIPRLSRDFIINMLVPVPPLPVQEEIVRILDSFTQLTAELQEKLNAELQARKKQYEYYRNCLLEPTEDTPIVKLGDFATVARGGNFQKKHFKDTGFPCIHYGQMYTHFGVSTTTVLKYLDEDEFEKSKKAVTNDIVMAVTSENVEDVCSCTAWLGDDEIAVSGHTAIVHHKQNAKYLSYYFRTEHFYQQKAKLAHGTKVIEVTPSKLLDCDIPLPSIAEQNRIVAILDRFDALCNNISAGLPAEIEARQKQYEYYRDKLLTFKKLS